MCNILMEKSHFISIEIFSATNLVGFLDTLTDVFFLLPPFAEAQQYHVYTLQPLANPLQRNSLTASSVLSQQQQEYIHQQQELKGMNKRLKLNALMKSR